MANAFINCSVYYIKIKLLSLVIFISLHNIHYQTNKQPSNLTPRLFSIN